MVSTNPNSFELTCQKPCDVTDFWVFAAFEALGILFWVAVMISPDSSTSDLTNAVAMSTSFSMLEPVGKLISSSSWPAFSSALLTFVYKLQADKEVANKVLKETC